MTTHAYIGRCDKCGGMALAVMDNPDYPDDTAEMVAEGIRDGLAIERVPVAEARTLPWCQCALCASKDKEADR